jgi:hypothetical protein
VHLPRDAVFDEERERYSFRFCCEDCGHWDAAAERCRHEWPNERHRLAHRSPVVTFCKEFELC